MQDILQPALEAAARQSGPFGSAAIFFASAGPFLLAALWLAAILWRPKAVTLALLARILLLLVLAYGLSKVGTHLVSDPRPFIVDGVPPLITVSQDNGFPSDHVLLAASLTATLWWIDRRLLSAFALATLLVMLGRLAVGAHHTLDVVGSVLIVLLAAAVAARLPVPPRWRRPLLARQLSA